MRQIHRHRTRSSRGLPVALVAVLVGATLGVAGCGSTALDMGQTEQDLGASLRQRTGMQIKAVVCPASVRAREGGRFICTAKLPEGETAAIRVVQADDDGTMRYSVGR